MNEDQVTKMAFEIDNVVRGYHVYKDVWNAHIGTELPCLLESSIAMPVVVERMLKSPCSSATLKTMSYHVMLTHRLWEFIFEQEGLVEISENKSRSKITRYTVSVKLHHVLCCLKNEAKAFNSIQFQGPYYYNLGDLSKNSIISSISRLFTIFTKVKNLSLGCTSLAYIVARIRIDYGFHFWEQKNDCGFQIPTVAKSLAT